MPKAHRARKEFLEVTSYNFDPYGEAGCSFTGQLAGIEDSRVEVHVCVWIRTCTTAREHAQPPRSSSSALVQGMVCGPTLREGDRLR